MATIEQVSSVLGLKPTEIKALIPLGFPAPVKKQYSLDQSTKWYIQFLKSKSESNVCTLNELAELLHLTPRYINELSSLSKPDHNMPKMAKGTYDRKACVQWYLNRIRKETERKTGDETLTEAKTRMMTTQANIKEIEFAKIRNEVVDVASVSYIFKDYIARTKSKLLGFPDKTAPLLAGVYDEEDIRTILSDSIVEILHEQSMEKFTPFRQPQPGRGSESVSEGLATTAKGKRKPVGGHGKNSAARGKRGSRPVANRKG